MTHLLISQRVFIPNAEMRRHHDPVLPRIWHPDAIDDARRTTNTNTFTQTMDRPWR
jgi:hypothetical protein